MPAAPESLPSSAVLQGLFNRKVSLRSLGVLRNILREPSRAPVHLLDAYVAGDLEVDYPLADFIIATCRPFKALGVGPRLRRTFNLPSERASTQQDITHHYDLDLAGKPVDVAAFFKLWLDASMTYTMGYWAPGVETLEEAQQAKWRLYQERLELKEGMRVYDSGFGFGAFIPYVLERGCTWSGANFSRAHCDYVREKYRDDPRVTVRQQDLHLPWEQPFDRMISIGVFEALADLPKAFAAHRAMLRDDGRFVMHLITTRSEQQWDYEAPSWIVERIFPNGRLYTHRHVLESAAPHFNVTFEHVFPPTHYRKTLHEWGRRFDASREQIAALGLPESFVRLWRLYLALSEAFFALDAVAVSSFVLTPRK